jgi:glycyl-tRNA synthetase beta chain
METKDFLLEIGTEELPAKSQQPLAEALEKNLLQQLDKADLKYAGSQTFSTPRRIAVQIHGLVSKQPPREMVRQGPSVKAAFDQSGTPTLAFMGFARSCGVSIDDVEQVTTAKGEYLQCKIKQPGCDTAELLPEMIEKAVAKLPLSKPMRWADNSFAFMRPVHWAVALFGRQAITASFLGVKTGRETRGHRFLHPDSITLDEPLLYVQALEQAKVIVNANKRRERIKNDIEKTAAPFGRALLDEELLAEVTGLVEWPVVLMGRFDARFLEVPAEALICSMQSHQKCFAITDANGKLQPHFILISNLQSRTPRKVIAGNERVINARLSDADFFYRQDLKTPLVDFHSDLMKVVFQNKLGTLADKSHRIGLIASHLAKQLGEDEKAAKRAAKLSKCDLLSEMVKEFPSLQGTMGYYYAKASDEPEALALAIAEHYQPKFSGDAIPASRLGQILALADKIDTLIGIIGIGQVPSGDKDPFALRRAALGILRILLEAKLPVDLHELLRMGAKHYKGALSNEHAVEQSFVFCLDRLKAWYIDQGVSVDIFDAVSATRPTSPVDFDKRLQAVRSFRTQPEAEALAQANKRVQNILKKQSGEKFPKAPCAKLFQTESEATLAHLLAEQSTQTQALLECSEYSQVLSELSSLKEPVDKFFDEVMIMDENLKVRHNRLALLQQLHHLLTQVADISLLQH